jgi:inorganic phosphate transporter, PiT family
MTFLILTAILAFYVTWNLGANDVANSMGTSVGSKAVTLRQALIIAGILEFSGAVLFGHQVSSTLATDIVDPSWFATDPQQFVMGMVSVLIATGIWLQLATSLGLPVASSHAVVGAIAGFGWIAIGTKAVAWKMIGVISLTWILTPVISGAIAACIYTQVSRWILQANRPIQQLYEWIPWLSAVLVSVFGFIVFPFVLTADRLQAIPLPVHDVYLGVGAIAAVGLTLVNWQRLNRGTGNAKKQDSMLLMLPDQASDTLLDPLPESSKIIEQKNTTQTVTQRRAVESVIARFQVLSACFVAFAHGSNDVGNGVAPLAAIVYIHNTGAVPADQFAVPTWILVLGGVGIVSGLAVLGKNVIKTIGEGIIPLQPSGGFCAELATATTVLLASRVGLPVSTSHALVGGVVGVGLVLRSQSPSNHQLIQFKTLRQVGLAWLVTIPFTAALSIGIFTVIRAIV